jgi:hypothetical protein
MNKPRSVLPPLGIHEPAQRKLLDRFRAKSVRRHDPEQHPIDAPFADRESLKGDAISAGTPGGPPKEHATLRLARDVHHPTTGDNPILAGGEVSKPDLSDVIGVRQSISHAPGR